MKMTRMIFVRHGESESNLGKYFTGYTNVALTDRGRAQAACAAKALKDAVE
jgi:broad specificity phosphatase PhoE